MLKGQIALIPHPVNWFQRTIEFVTNAPVHHVIVAEDEDTVISAEIPKVRRRPVSHFPNAIWSNFDYTPQQRDDIAAFAADQVGKWYALLDDIFIAIAIETKHNTPPWLIRELMNTHHWQCAELADASLLAGRINLFTDGRPPCAVFPGSFIPTFRENGWWPSYLDKASR